MKVLVDAQLPPGCVAVLRDLGIEALHVEDIGLRHAADASVELWAIANGCVLLTKDRDFVGRVGLQVIWVRKPAQSRPLSQTSRRVAADTGWP